LVNSKTPPASVVVEATRVVLAVYSVTVTPARPLVSSGSSQPSPSRSIRTVPAIPAGWVSKKSLLLEVCPVATVTTIWLSLAPSASPVERKPGRSVSTTV